MIYKEDYEEHEHEGCCSWDEERIKKMEKRIEKLELKISQLIDALYKKAMIKFEIEGDK